ncbi:mechanosensitive ion channel domain-containing protein [Rubritalea sp.]|uniref:mechanosensitive ion channel domain-containing protein n=1 Tax=Rubritalea sp. TaxID=2109375 RepID=UPI003EF3EBDB
MILSAVHRLFPAFLVCLVCSSTVLAQNKLEPPNPLVSEPIDLSQEESLANSVKAGTSRAQAQLIDTLAKLELVNSYRDNAVKRINLIESAGLRIDAKTGQLLRQQRAHLPTAFLLKRQLNQVNVDITNAEITLLDLTNTDDSSQIDSAKKSLEALYKEYIITLGELANVTRHTLAATNSYANYLDERLLWITSAKRINAGEFQTELNAVTNLFSSKTLGQLFKGLRNDISEHPLIWTIVILPLILFFSSKKRIKYALEKLAAKACQRNCLSISPSLIALILTLLRSQTLPLFLVFIAWRSSAPISWSVGFLAAAQSISLLSFLHALSSQHGLLDAHFETAKAKTKLLYFHTTWALFSIPVFLFLAYALPAAGTIPAGRISFIIAMLLCTYFAHSLLNPKKRLLAREQTPNWLLKLLYFLGVITPVIFIVGYALGYLASVQTLLDHTVSSIIVVSLTYLFARLCSRWILISRRLYAKHHARKKYEALKAEKSNDSTNEVPSLEEIEANEVNIQAVEIQTRHIIRFLTVITIMFALWNIWSPVLPALTALDNVSIVNASHHSTDSASSETPSASQDSNPVNTITNTVTPSDDSSFFSSGLSVGDVIAAILIIVFTIVAARNLPGLLELSILRKLNLRPGGNYAITTISRYIVIATGLLAAFSSVGVTWGSVKWLAAAVTLGIGFGLQEIFANFVAGLIILFERPVRLGDIVTIGDVSGRVTQIKIRATTIKQFNNRELLVPNKEFITGQLINWSLCDNILRFEVSVGIAYGSDTKKATEILEDLVSKHPHVLEDPAPDILFQGFGASSLDFMLRGFVNHYEFLLPTQSELHYQIDAAFREANIEIAFPQTDIHIKSLPAKASEKE